MNRAHVLYDVRVSPHPSHLLVHSVHRHLRRILHRQRRLPNVAPLFLGPGIQNIRMRC